MKRRVPPWVSDTVIGVGLFVLALASLRDYQDLGVTDVFLRQTDVFGYLLIAVQTLPLVLRRRYPVVVLAVVLAGFFLDRGLDYPGTMATLGPLFAIHAVGLELSPRRSAVIGGAAIAVVSGYTLYGAVILESVGYDDAAIVLLTALVALYLGREGHQRRTVNRLLQERAERAERDREEAAAAAVADERARIARELHDVVAHQIVVMTLQAEGAARLDKDGDPRVREALATISGAGREGLAEMRRMVGLLRAEGEDEPREPQPGLQELPRLAQHFAESGLPVDVHVSGEPRRLPGGVDLSAYRIVQESLTNALKHGGPGVHADVTVSYGADAVDITVVDDGRGAATPLNGSGGGHGLVGMRERVGLLEGTLETGPHAGGGFQVHATLPVRA
ncbi:MAG: histidine kinase [Candidatus Nanopelagicales bacterium]